MGRARWPGRLLSGAPDDLPCCDSGPDAGSFRRLAASGRLRKQPGANRVNGAEISPLPTFPVRFHLRCDRPAEDRGEDPFSPPKGGRGSSPRSGQAGLWRCRGRYGPAGGLPSGVVAAGKGRLKGKFPRFGSVCRPVGLTEAKRRKTWETRPDRSPGWLVPPTGEGRGIGTGEIQGEMNSYWIFQGFFWTAWAARRSPLPAS